MASLEIQKSIIQTLVYFDIFNHPLSLDELWFFIGKKIDRETLLLELSNLSSVICIDNKWFCLKKRANIIKERIKNEKESQRKLSIAKHVVSLLSHIPTIYLIGISGSLAMNNVKKNDDIDFFIITKKNKVWITRLISIFLLDVLNVRRKRGQKVTSDKICLNMFLDETAISFPKVRHNIYTSHEIVQMAPLFERKNMYRRFLEVNKWVKKFLPNSLHAGSKPNPAQILKESFLSKSISYIFFNPLLEYVSKFFQMWYIKRHVTTETISDHFLAFHPRDYGEEIFREYKKKLKLYAEI